MILPLFLAMYYLSAILHVGCGHRHASVEVAIPSHKLQNANLSFSFQQHVQTWLKLVSKIRCRKKDRILRYRKKAKIQQEYYYGIKWADIACQPAKESEEKDSWRWLWRQKLGTVWQRIKNATRVWLFTDPRKRGLVNDKDHVEYDAEKEFKEYLRALEEKYSWS